MSVIDSKSSDAYHQQQTAKTGGGSKKTAFLMRPAPNAYNSRPRTGTKAGRRASSMPFEDSGVALSEKYFSVQPHRESSEISMADRQQIMQFVEDRVGDIHPERKVTAFGQPIQKSEHRQRRFQRGRSLGFLPQQELSFYGCDTRYVRNEA